MDFAGESFSGLRLEGEAFSAGVLEDCLFTRCRFQNLQLKNLRVTGCHFEECTFGGLACNNLSCMGNSFQGCSIAGVDWSALLEERKRDMGFLPFDSLAQCTLHHNVFFGLDLRRFDFHGCDLAGSYFDDCNLSQADFSGCTLDNAAFSHNDLTGADFRHATGYAFSLESNRAKGARFTLPEAIRLLAALGVRIDEE